MSEVEIVLAEAGPYRWRIEPRPPMRVPGVVFANGALLPQAAGDHALEQVANVATLPGIVRASYAMPDVHWGYGFPIGGVAATDVGQGGVVSPGGVGFDISCGVRLLAAGVDRDELDAERIRRLMDLLDRTVPRGLGRGGLWHLAGPEELDELLLGGARYAVEHGHGVPRDLERFEDRGVLAGAAGPSNGACSRSAASARPTTSWRCRPSTGCTTRRRPPPSGCGRARSA